MLTTLNIRMNFKPTYLYIKQHAITGMLYFGKTTQADPIRYRGSGLYWKSHIKKHGLSHVVTLWYDIFNDVESLMTFSKEFSTSMNIVASPAWANLVEETGIDGGTVGRTLSDEVKLKISLSGTGWKHTDEARKKISSAAKTRVVSDQTRKTLSEVRRGTQKSDRMKKSLSTNTSARILCSCIVCRKEASIPHLSRYHKHH